MAMASLVSSVAVRIVRELTGNGGNMNTTRVDVSKVRTAKGDWKTICGDRVTMTIICSLSEGFEEGWPVGPTVAIGRKRTRSQIASTGGFPELT